MQLRQLFDKDSSTYSYLLWDEVTREAVMIDPVLEQSERDIRLITELGLNLRYALETHIHADHITGGGLLRERFSCLVGVHENAAAGCADIALKEGDQLRFGESSLTVLHTPGHTNTDISYLAKECLFTGDTLLVRGSGRTDFQSGDAGQAYDSITQKLFVLPDDFIVYPAHDYNGQTATTIGEEKKYNPRLGNKQTRAGYIKIMNSLVLEKPGKIDVAVPGNQRCGISAMEGLINQAGEPEA
ncbi:MAG: MBL fold metallo-hydrolase [Sedimenticola sp.]|nr:MBL fold metallo-hydrolase [Sedimenticola sp.]MCW8946326.1 MBL fold metallo-hydrolase [Sedimenticola sp.]MCW8975779.1 MBL fold metallo-hydrolase [Sedimenticola sp.]MDF1529152.1 MBL fold metallo-hydrolase [Sedimenticola sp.]